MVECGDDKRFTFLFTKGCQHLNVSVIFITQNLFHKRKKNERCISQRRYLILFKYRRDQNQIMHLGVNYIQVAQSFSKNCLMMKLKTFCVSAN